MRRLAASLLCLTSALASAAAPAPQKKAERPEHEFALEEFRPRDDSRR